MIYLDTNVLVYATIDQSIQKKDQSINLLKQLVNDGMLNISSLVLQEYSYTLAKLKIPSSIIFSDILFYSQFSYPVTMELFLSASELCSQLTYYKNINDVIHLKYAEKYCSKLITFDTDFERLKQYTPLSIEILK